MDLNERAIIMLAKEKAYIIEKVENAETCLLGSLTELEKMMRSDKMESASNPALHVIYQQAQDALYNVQNVLNTANVKEGYDMLPF